MKRERKAAHFDSKAKGSGKLREKIRGSHIKRANIPVQEVSKKTKLLWLFIITTVTLIAYYPAFDNEITSWDDEFYINENPYLKDLSGENVSKLFDFDTYYMGNYHPLAMISLSIDYAIGGEDENGNINPFIFHFTNIILHILVSLLVFWFVLALLKNFNIAVIAGLLFGVHTLHVESVVWISERKDVLYSLFFVASLVSYVKYIDNKKISLYILSLILFSLSLFSKGQAVSLAVTIIIIDFLRKRKLSDLKIIAEKIPFFALAIFFGLVAIGAQKESEALVDEQAYTFVQRIGIASFAFMQYVIKLILPVNLSAINPYPDIIGQKIPGLYYLMIIPVFLIAGLFFWLLKKGKNILVFSIAFFVANIFLLLQFIPVGSAVYADRYAYIPSIGFFILIAFLIMQMIQKNEKNKMIFYGFTGFYIVVLAGLSFMRSEIWQNSETLWNDTVEKSPKSVVAWNNLGSYKDKKAAAAMEDLRFDEAKRLRLEAIGNFSKAIAGKPDYKNAFYNRGVSSFEVGKLMKDSSLIVSSIKDFDKALEQDAQFPDAYHNRGNAKAELGKLEAALKDFNLAIDLKPNESNFYANRGVTKGKLGDLKGAFEDFNMSLSIDPNESAVYSNRGKAKMLGGDVSGAIADYDIAVRINPKHHTAYFNRALAKQKSQDLKGALEDFNAAISINPKMADAYYFRGFLFLDLNNKEAACNDFKQASYMGIAVAGVLLQQYCQ
ncbi:MAG: tetratricopeptide repeat protein [Bacteroidales bacterium]|nr:tetratricopeptide repeat protein [Bacteroidales bacterium]